MNRKLKPSISACLLLISASAFASRDRTAPVAPVAAPTAPTPPAAPHAPLRVLVAPGADDDHYVFVANSKDGGTHEIKVESKNGLVIIEGEPDPKRAWLGVLLDYTDDGMIVNGVMDDSPAARAGLEAGDLIKELDGAVVDGESHLLDGRKPGDRVELAIERDGAEKKLTVKLGSHPGRMEFKSEPGMAPFAIAGDVLGSMKALEPLRSLKGLPGFNFGSDDSHVWAFAMGGRPRLGVEVERLSDQLAEYFGTKGGEGLLVKAVSDDMPATKAGIKAGDVLLRVGDTAISDASDIREALADVKKGDRVDVEILRKGERRTLSVELESDPVSDDATEHSWLAAPDKRVMVLKGLAAEDCKDLDGVLGPEEAARVRAELARARAEMKAIDLQAIDSDSVRKSVEEAHAALAQAQRRLSEKDAAAMGEKRKQLELELLAKERALSVAPPVGRSL